MNTTLWYLIGAPAWCFILLSAMARLADLDIHQPTWRTVRKFVGMVGAGVAAVVMLLGPFTADVQETFTITWRSPLIAWSWAIVWALIGPPWLDMVLGVHRDVEAWKGKGLMARIRGELRAIRSSFVPNRYRMPR